jgi:hypothetical protein
MLSDNLYAVRRTEKKHRDRDPTRRTVRSGELFRPELIDLMRDALGRLEAVAVKDAYTDRDIDGLGKNFLLEATRRRAITAYRFHVRLYALLGLKDRFRQVLDAGGDPDQILDLDLPDVTTHWQHQRSILRDDFSGGAVAALALLPEMLEQAANDVEASRRKDDERGRRIIEDYEAVHPPAAADPLVRHTWQEARRLQRETEELLDRLGWTGRSRGQVG